MSTLSVFFESEVQSVLALFLTKPELYKNYATERDRQGYFFGRFRKFAEKYYHFSGDESVYFGSVRKEVAGEANICGGSGKMSGASSRYFKGKYKAIEESREKQIDEFAKKYGISFEAGKDPRLYLGVTEIWNKLARSAEIVAASNWADVTSMAYDDATFEMTISKQIQKQLVPFEIRNRVMQKVRNLNRKVTSGPIRNTNLDDSEDETVVSTDSANNSAHAIEDLSGLRRENGSSNIGGMSVAFVMPAEVFDDW
jgi:hypothetical protein